MTNSVAHSIGTGEGVTDPWQPVPVPRRGCGDDERLTFFAYMLAPGFTLVFHAQTLKRSLTSIANYRRAALKRAHRDPSVMVRAHAFVSTIRPEHGLSMAQARGPSQLPYWSRLAIGEFRKRGLTRSELASAFHCSRGTIANVLNGRGQGFDILSGVRRLTASQKIPSGMWTTVNARIGLAEKASNLSLWS